MAKTAKKTVRTKEHTEVTEAQIAVHWKEEDLYQPPESFKAQAKEVPEQGGVHLRARTGTRAACGDHLSGPA